MALLSFLVVYVDEIILIGNNIEGINLVKKSIDHNCKMKDLGVLNYFLDIKIEYLENEVLLHKFDVFF